MTNRDFYNAIINGTLVIAPTDKNSVPTSKPIIMNGEIIPELVNYATEQIKKLDEKNEKKRNTVSKSQSANNELKIDILNFMDSEEIYVASAIAEQFNLTTQKVSALMKQLAEKEMVQVIDNYKTKKGKVKGYKKIG